MLFLRWRRNRLSMAAPPMLDFLGTAMEPVYLPSSTSPSPSPLLLALLHLSFFLLALPRHCSPPSRLHLHPKFVGFEGWSQMLLEQIPFAGDVLRVCSRRAGPVELRAEFWMFLKFILPSPLGWQEIRTVFQSDLAKGNFIECLKCSKTLQVTSENFPSQVCIFCLRKHYFNF